jgi:predicted acetyltransferase
MHDIVLWQDDSGEPQGYAAFILPDKGPDLEKVVVIELVAMTGDAYANLLTYFGRYDLHREIVIHASPYDALPLHFLDTERLEFSDGFSVLLRIVDFEAAMTARPPARTEEAAELVIRVDDRTAPWNDGVWRVGVAEGRTMVKRADEEPELTVSERILAPLYNGHLRPSLAYEAGLLAATSEGAIELADRIFAVTRPPYFPDHF